MARREELVDELAPYLLPEGEAHPWLGDGGVRAGDPAASRAGGTATRT